VEAEILEEFADQANTITGFGRCRLAGISITAERITTSWDTASGDVNYSSARAPFYATSKKYGVYVETTGKGRFSIAQGGGRVFRFSTRN